MTSWTAACQASLSFTISQSLLKLMSIELVMPSNHNILCFPFSSCLQSSPTSESFPMSQLFASGGQNIKDSASASVLPMNIQGWFPTAHADFYWQYRQVLKIQSCGPNSTTDNVRGYRKAFMHCFGCVAMNFWKGILNNSIYGNFFIEIISRYVTIYLEQL